MPLPRMTDDQLIDYVLDQPMGRTEAMRWLIAQVRQQEREQCASLADALMLDCPIPSVIYRKSIGAAIRATV